MIKNICIALACLLSASLTVRAEERSFDVVVYGGTGGGVIAAVEVARLGKSVALIEPARQIGGMTSGGLGATDIGVKSSVIGAAKEFYHRIWKHYKDPAAWKYETREEYAPKHHDALSEGLEVQWFFEPKVAEQVLNEMADEAGVKIFAGQRLKRPGGVAREGAKIVSLTTENGDIYKGKVFIDASYEGDLMAAACHISLAAKPTANMGNILMAS
jgi:flavin-dependent dehydrogenase